MILTEDTVATDEVITKVGRIKKKAPLSLTIMNEADRKNLRVTARLEHIDLIQTALNDLDQLT